MTNKKPISGTGTYEAFTVQGATGVDLVLNIAGTGSRSYAFVIDWHIRVLLLLLLWLLAYLLSIPTKALFSSDASPWIVFLILLPAFIVYFFYHPVLELLMRGQTPGKRIAGVRVVARDGSAPSAGAILIRNVFRLIDAMPAFYLIGLITTIFSMQRVRIGDMAAGTLLIVDEQTSVTALDRFQSISAHSTLDASTLDLVAQVLNRWRTLDSDKRISIARSLLQRIENNPSVPIDELSETALHTRLLAVLQEIPS